MKLLLKMFTTIPEQVASTLLWFGAVYIICRGIVAIVTDLPSPNTLLMVLGVGVVFGIIASFTKQSSNSNNKRK